jgi:hypothetical protein
MITHALQRVLVICHWQAAKLFVTLLRRSANTMVWNQASQLLGWRAQAMPEPELHVGEFGYNQDNTKEIIAMATKTTKTKAKRLSKSKRIHVRRLKQIAGKTAAIPS